MVGQRNMLDNRKSQTNAVTGMLILIAAAIEPFKNTVLFADGDAVASIENTDYRFRMPSSLALATTFTVEPSFEYVIAFSINFASAAESDRLRH